MRYILSFLSLLSILILVNPDFGFPVHPPFVIEATIESLTLRVTNAPLKEVLAEIVKQSGVQITIHGELEGLCSADFSDLSLEEGLKRLVKDFNHVFIYGPEASKKSDLVIQKVIIYAEKATGLNWGETPRVVAPQKQPSQPSTAPSFEELVKALGDTDPEIREETVDVMADMEDERVIGHLTRVLLSDKDGDVRESAAMALEDLADRRSIGPLVRALRDPYAGVRESAVDALREIGGEDVIRPLMGALKDEDEDVREAAARALKRLTGREYSQ